MKLRTILATAALAATVACSPARRHKVLTMFFDGVPPPKTAEAAAPSTTATAAPVRRLHQGVHGPYAARLCQSCHDSSSQNALVAPLEQLCVQCHELPPAKKYVHGPLASGGCTVCHDPHSSGFRYLLVSASDGFCFHCHDRAAVERVRGHEGVGEQCTTCHDAHMSDKEYLLK